ncbi:hypothetical protein [Candidatus Liberibacter brunswickensis]|uniref:hypothetical protein n=1 Tax=Candidatus Liberibacter brunswickensis TaxID=1968796 RepID=UPI002FE04BB2
MGISKKDINKLAMVAREKNVMIEFTEDGRCLRIYPEFDSKGDMYPSEPLDPYQDFQI